MAWLLVISGALVGGVVATVLEDAVGRRRAYRTAMVLIRAELSRNATWVEQGKTVAATPHKDKMFAPGRIVASAWETHQPALAWRFWHKSPSLWAELSATYTTLQVLSATGTEPPDQIVGDLRSLEDSLGRFDPTWVERLVVYLATHRGTKHLGVALASRLSGQA